MPERTSYEPGVPCWIDLATTDMPGAVAFYSALFGWTCVEAEDPEAGGYTTATLRDKAVAGLFGQSEEMKSQGVPPNWTTYFATTDADATAKQAEAAGGTVFAPAFDVLDVGRMAVIADTVGAAFGVWQARAHLGAGLVNEPGTLSWNELITADPPKAAAFYREVFGHEVENFGPPEPEPYRILKVGDNGIAGILKKPDDMPAEMPAVWMTYFAVSDTDAIVAKAKELGGSVMAEPFDVPEVGRIAILLDPAFAAFGVITNANPTT
jgi:uncharacterized protein